jgi:predicted small secreted protein
MKPILRSALILTFVAAAVALTACNTTRGVGEDIEAAGSGIKNSAERNGAN